jgi:hypothetical protein
MVKTDIFLASNKDQPVGYVITSEPIAGSRINDYKVGDVWFDTRGKGDPIKWLMSSVFKIPGGVRPQTIWNFTSFETEITEDGIGSYTLHGVIFRPEGMCVACAGTGKFRSSTHRATAKCPGCKGTGFTKAWQEDQEEKNGTEKVVGESENAASPGGSQETPLREGSEG